MRAELSRKICKLSNTGPVAPEVIQQAGMQEGGLPRNGALCPIHTSKTCLVNRMKISNRKLKNCILHRVQVSTNLCFHCAKFEVNKDQFKQLCEENNFKPCLTKQL